MYFENRFLAGEQLAQALFDKYRYEDCAIIALNDGGVIVADPISQVLHTFLMMLVTEKIAIPGENLDFGSVSQNGNFTYDSNLSKFEIDEYTSEFNGYLQDQKRQAFQRINRLMGDGGTVDLKMLSNRNIILVTDSFDQRVSIEAVLDFLRPVKVKKIIAAAPIANVELVNKLHMLVDEIVILDVKANYFGVDHYYDDNTMLDHQEMIRRINQNILKWR